MVTIMAGIVIIGIGWLGFLFFIAPLLAAAKVIQIANQDRKDRNSG